MGMSIEIQPHILPVADLTIRVWLESHGINSGKPVLVQFEFQDDKPKPLTKAQVEQAARARRTGTPEPTLYDIEDHRK